MSSLSLACLFCEDIREEKTGQDTIIGVMPDNLHMLAGPPPSPTAKAALPRLGAYLRINMSLDRKPNNISAKLITPGGDTISQSEWASDVLDRAFAEAKSNEMPYAGLIWKVVAAPIPVSNGKLKVIVTIDGEDHLAGALNLIFSTASPPPA